MQAHLEMGDNIRYEDLRRIAEANGRSVDETLEIVQRTVEKDRREHEQEYSARPRSS
jgi:hypothetical protein